MKAPRIPAIAAARGGLFALAILLVSSSARAVGDGGSPPTPEAKPPPTELVEQLLRDTRERIDAVLALDPQIASASGEQRAVLEEQRRVRTKEAGDRLQALVSEVSSLRERGIEDAGASRKLAEFLDRAAHWNEEQTRAVMAELDRLQRESETASDADAGRFDSELREANLRLDDLLAARLRTHQNRERFGVDATKGYERLDELLKARAETRAGQVRVARKRITEYAAKVAAASEDEAKALNADLARYQDRLGQGIKSLESMAKLMDARSLPTAEYRQLIIEASGVVTVDIFKRDVALGLLQQWWRDFQTWLAERGPAALFNFFVAVFITLAFHLVARLTQRILRRALQSAKPPVTRLFQEFALTMTYRVVIGLGFLIALAQLGVQIGPVLAGLGVASFIVGFALQDTLGNFASGMLILAYRPFDVGDVVSAAGVSGRVEAMTLVTTTILTFDNQRLIVPNSKIWGDVITNVTAERVRRVDLTFGIGYRDDVAHAESVLRAIVEKHPKVLPSPEPTIKLHELGDSSVNFVVRPWALTVDYWDVYWDVTRQVKERFDAEGISIPFPQRHVHVESVRAAEE